MQRPVNVMAGQGTKCQLSSQDKSYLENECFCNVSEMFMFLFSQKKSISFCEKFGIQIIIISIFQKHCQLTITAENNFFYISKSQSLIYCEWFDKCLTHYSKSYVPSEVSSSITIVLFIGHFSIWYGSYFMLLYNFL